MVLTISTLELSVVAAAVASISIVALGMSAAPAVLEAQGITTEEEEESLDLEVAALND